MTFAGTGTPLSSSSVKTLASSLMKIQGSFAPDALPLAQARHFEAAACEVVHRELPLPPSVASDPGFWRWITFGACDDELCRLVDWRFGSQRSIADVNYGIASRANIWEGLYARLWLRGHLGHSSSGGDPYDVARRGDMDIWRSHILRQEFGRCRKLARALVCYQYPAGRAASRRGRLRVQHLRDLAKRLRILHASVSFEILDYDAVYAIVENQATLARRGLEG